jgi:uncharacterized membrane protein YgcG
MRRIIVAASLAMLAFSAFAVPSVGEVQAEVAKGNYAHAEAMMREVVTARPSSARAHYLYAEILAHDRQFDQAADQARLAQTLDPAITFTQPDKFRSFEALLEREQAHARRSPSAATGLSNPAPMAAALPAALSPQRSSGLPGWVWVLGLVAVGLLIWKLFSGRQQSMSAVSYSPGFNGGGAGPMPMPMGGGYGPGMMAPPSAGSGLLGTGLAVAGGVAAGMLAEKLIDGRRDESYGPSVIPAPFNDGGASAAAEDQRALEERPVDFGQGGSDDGGWGGGGGGGGFDDGGGSSGGDGGW